MIAMTAEISTILSYIYIIVVIITVVLVVVLLRKHNRKKYNEILTRLEREKNLILSGVVLTELNKVAALINSKELEEKYKSWQERYLQIKDTEVPKLNDGLIELENMFGKTRFAEVQTAIAKLELDIYYVKTKFDFLLAEIKEISLSESKNREIVTKLKTDYREIFLKYSNNRKDYVDIRTTLELQFENVDKLFAAFEKAASESAYQEVPKIVKALDDIIGNLTIAVNEAPTIILMGKKLIPVKIGDIRHIANKMIKEGFNLDYLNIDYNIAESEKKIADVFDRLNVLNLADSLVELKTILAYFESLYNDFDNERASKKSYEEKSRKMAVKCRRMLDVISKIHNKIEDFKYSFDLSNDEVKIIDELNINIKTIQSDYETLVEHYRNKSFAFSRLNNEIEHLTLKLAKNEEKLDITLRSLSSLKEDEARAKDQLEDIKMILKHAKEKIADYKLPVIPKAYYVQLSEANEAIDEMITELTKQPISIKVLNTRVDTARDLVLKLFKTTNETIKTAKMAENTIIYGNRFRPLNDVLDGGLTIAEKKFMNGNYKDALERAINSISLVDANIHDKMLEVYKNEKAN